MATKIENYEVIPDDELNKIIEEINNEEDKRLKVIVDEYQQLTQNGFFVLDTETTDLVGEVVSFSLIDDKNNILINEYCKPTRNKISKTAQSIHNISNKMIKDSRNIIPIYEDFLKIINTEENKNKTIFIYNEGFDLSTIYRSLNYAGYKYKENNDFDDVEFRSRCVMKDFAYFYGEHNEYYDTDKYKWKKLEFAANYFNIETKNLKLHNSAVDCYLTLKVIENIRDHFKKENEYFSV